MKWEAAVGGMLGGLISSAVIIIGAGPSGAFPRSAQVGFLMHSQQPFGNPLAAAYGIAQHRGIPGGGPQALEGYVYSNPPAGESVRLAMAVISNGEHAGAGETIEMRAAGGFVSGSGRVRQWWMHRPVVGVSGEGGIDFIAAYGAVVPTRNVRERWFIYSDDATLPSRVDGPMLVQDLRFANGWSLRVVDGTVALVRSDGTLSHIFR
jgi:hypothetical protein